MHATTHARLRAGAQHPPGSTWALKVDSSQRKANQLVPVESGRHYKISAVLQHQDRSIQVRLA